MRAPMRASMRSVLGMFAIAAGLAMCAAQALAAGATASQAALPPKQLVALSTGIRMAYLDMGNPTGRPVLFLHGYTDTARSFYPTAQALLAEDPSLRVLVLDLRGHGGSSMPPAAQCAQAPEACFRPSDMAADVVAFMNQAQIGSAAVVGHSMGSFVAQELALTYPHRVERMVLIGTSAKLRGNAVLQDYIVDGYVEGAWKAGFEAQGYAFPGQVYDLSPLDAQADALAWITEAWVVDPAVDPAFLAAIVPETAAVKMGAWVGAARALLQVDNTERLKHLAVPTMILWATQDAFFYENEQAELLASLDIPAAACKMSYVFKQYGKRSLSESGIQIDDVGHNTQWATPEQTAADIASYLKQRKPGRDWYYSADGDPRVIVTEKGKAPIQRAPGNKNCGF